MEALSFFAKFVPFSKSFFICTSDGFENLPKHCVSVSSVIDLIIMFLSVRAGKFVARKNWVVTGSVSVPNP